MPGYVDGIREKLEYKLARLMLSGLFSKTIWLVLGAGAVRNRTYRCGRTVSYASLVSIKFLANRELS